MLIRGWTLCVALTLAGCGGGGGSGTIPFVLNGSSPELGATDAPIDAPVLLVFNRPTDPATITLQNIRFEQEDGTPIAFEIFVQGFNAASISIAPLTALKQNVAHRVTLTAGIKAPDGTALREQTICFITKSLTPTVRPDQLIDLGDALNVPRFLARSIRLPDGRILIIGGFTDPQTATDTLEVYQPATRSFRVLDARLSVPRAEHTVTQMIDGRVMIAGGVSTPGGAPLASTEFFNLVSEKITSGPEMNEARTWHAASAFKNGESVMVSGGFDENGDEKTTVERLVTGAWRLLNEELAIPTARGIQFSWDFDKVYFSASNLSGVGALFDGAALRPRQEGDIRFRPAYTSLGNGRFLIVGGDTRSAITYVFSSGLAWGGTDFLFERRGAHTLTTRGGLGGRRLLIAGGFNIAQVGSPPLRTLEIVDALDPGPFGFPDVAFYRVDNLLLPVPYAGHIGFNEPDGPTVLAGGVGDGVGPHSRRVVVILDNRSSPTIDCK